MRQLSPGLHVAEQAQRFFGLEVGARMTVLRLQDGVLLHSPIAVDPEALGALGSPRWVLAPNLLHHLHVGPWLDRGAESYCPPGLQAKRPDLAFDHVLEGTTEPFGDEVLVIPLQCLDMTRELVVLHRPSRTLIVSDLVFNFSASAPWLTRAAMRCLWGYPGCRTTLIERALIRRDVAREEISGLLELDFDRLILAHGEIVEVGGRDALARAFAWLL